MSRTLTAEEDYALRLWLVANDVALYCEGASWRKAAKRFNAEHPGVEVSGATVKTMAAECCSAWAGRWTPTRSRRFMLSGDQWGRVCAWLREHEADVAGKPAEYARQKMGEGSRRLQFSRSVVVQAGKAIGVELGE